MIENRSMNKYRRDVSSRVLSSRRVSPRLYRFRSPSGRNRRNRRYHRHHRRLCVSNRHEPTDRYASSTAHGPMREMKGQQRFLSSRASEGESREKRAETEGSSFARPPRARRGRFPRKTTRACVRMYECIHSHRCARARTCTTCT